MSDIAKLAALEGAELRAAKQALAFHATVIVHGKAEAERAQNAARAAFGGGGGDLVPTHVVSAAEVAAGLKTVDLLAAAGLASSKSVARRLVEQGGVRFGDRKVGSVEDVIQPSEIGADGTLLHAGKKHVRRIVVRS